jgi:ubiquitin C
MGIIKQKIQHHNEIQTDKQHLIFAGMQLKDDHTVSDYNIRSGSSLHLVLRFNDSTKIFVKISNDQILTWDLEPSDSLNAIKQKIQNIVGIPADQQHLLFGGRQLECGYTITVDNIQNKMTFLLILRGRMQIQCIYIYICQASHCEDHHWCRRILVTHFALSNNRSKSKKEFLLISNI